MRFVSKTQQVAPNINRESAPCGLDSRGSAPHVTNHSNWWKQLLSIRLLAAWEADREMTKFMIKQEIPSMRQFIANATGSAARNGWGSLLSLAVSTLLLSSSAISLAQTGAAISGQATTPGGTPASGARITVCSYMASGIPCSPQASIYSNPNLTGSPLPQPYAADQFGNYSVWVAPGTSYLVQVQYNPSATPFTYFYTAAAGGGGTVTACSPATQYAIAYYLLSSTSLACDPNFLDTPTMLSYNLSGVALPSLPGNTDFAVIGVSGVSTRALAVSYGGTAYHTSLTFGGTAASPAAVSSGTELGGFNAWGYDGTSIGGPAAAFRAYANQTWVPGGHATYADVAVTATGSVTEQQVAFFDQYGTHSAINGGLTTQVPTATTPALKQDGRLVNNLAISTSAGTTTVTSATVAFTSADNSRIAIIYPKTGVNTTFVSSPQAPGALPISTAGTGWNLGDRCNITQSGASGGIANVIQETGGVPSIVALENNGQNYSVANGVSCVAIPPSAGTGLAINITVLGTSNRAYTGALTVTNATTATLTGTYSGINTTGATMILGTDDGAAFNALVNTIPLASSKGGLSLGCKPIITTVPLVITGSRGTQIEGCGLSSGINAGLAAGAANGTTIIWAGAADPVTLSVSAGVVTLTDLAGHPFSTGYCHNTQAECLVNVQGTISQPLLSGTFLITNPNTSTSTTLTFAAPYGVVNGTDSGYMPKQNIIQVQNCEGCTISNLNIMGSDQPSTKPYAAINPTDASGAGVYPDSMNVFSNIWIGNVVTFGALPGNSYISTSTAQWGIHADGVAFQNDRNQFQNVHVMNADIAFGSEASQPVDWTISGTNGCYFSGSCVAMINANQWHVSGTMEALQNGVDYLLANGGHLEIAQFNEETDGPARVYAPQGIGPGDAIPGTSMLYEAFASSCCGNYGGVLSIEHGDYAPSAYEPRVIGLPTYVSGGTLNSSGGSCVLAGVGGGGQGALLTMFVSGGGGFFNHFTILSGGGGYSTEPTSWTYVSGSGCSSTVTTTGGTITSDMVWSSGNGMGALFNDFVWGAAGSFSEPVIGNPTIDLTNSGFNNTVFRCTNCSGITTQNIKVPQPGVGASNHVVVAEIDSPNGIQGGGWQAQQGINILAGTDSTALDMFRRDIAGTMRVLGGYVNIPQLSAPANIQTFSCATSGSTTYYYKATALNGASQETTPSPEFNTGANCASTVSSTNTVSGVYNSVPGASSYNIYRSNPALVSSGTYTSGGSITGSSTQTCTLTNFNNGSTATATVALTSSNTIASGTALVITSMGTGATSAPTSATLGNGTATCSGTATIATVVGGPGTEGLVLNVPANSYTGQITPYSGNLSTFIDSTATPGVAPPIVNATGWLNVNGGISVNGLPITGNTSIPTVKSTTGDLICAEAADSTILSSSITAVSSTPTSLIFTISGTPALYTVGQLVQTQGNSTSGYNGGPWTVTATPASQVVVSSTTNPGAGTAGGTLSLYCSNQATDAGGNFVAFNTTYTLPANYFGAQSASVKVRPQFGVYSASAAEPIQNFAWSLNSTNIWKSSGNVTLSAPNNAANAVGTYPLDLTALCGYYGCSVGAPTAVFASVPPFTLGGTTAITDTTGLTGTGLPPITINTAISQIISLQVRYKATGVVSGTYTSGITATGTTGQTCTLTSFNDSSTATATVALTGTNTIAGGTALVITARGNSATAAPTSATAGNGTATCSGTATIATVLGGSPGNAMVMYGMALTQ